MRFTKMHGIGNDYVYVNGFAETVADPPALARVIADRHFGVGGDGLILILPPEQGVDAHVRMRMFNADGSESEMCGNGIRCVAKYAHDHGLTQARPMRVQTGNGVLSMDYTTNGDGKLVAATVDMGEPILEPARIPVSDEIFKGPEPIVDYPYRCEFIGFGDPVNDYDFAVPMTCVSLGNPHAVFFVESIDEFDWESIGSNISELSAWFPNRTNVHFVEVISTSEVRVVHWERGSGPTLACGTGACAVCVAGVLTGRTDRRITAHLPGGDLVLEWRESDNHVYMTGSATEVFTGEWPARPA